MNKYLTTEVRWDSQTNIYKIHRFNKVLELEDDYLLKNYARYSGKLNNLVTPFILTQIYWPDIMFREHKFDKLNIEFTNYATKHENYTIIMKVIKKDGKQIIDGFSSTSTQIIDSLTCLKNILSFLEFVEK